MGCWVIIRAGNAVFLVMKRTEKKKTKRCRRSIDVLRCEILSGVLRSSRKRRNENFERNRVAEKRQLKMKVVPAGDEKEERASERANETR